MPVALQLIARSPKMVSGSAGASQLEKERFPHNELLNICNSLSSVLKIINPVTGFEMASRSELLSLGNKNPFDVLFISKIAD